MSKLVKVQKTQVRRIRPSEKIGHEGSPYWNYLVKRASTDENSRDSGASELVEPVQANPDGLSEADGMYYISEDSREKQKLVQTAIKRSKLSKRERQVVDLLTYSNRTQAEVSDLLGISQPVVSIYYNRALKKIKKFIEKENN